MYQTSEERSANAAAFQLDRAVQHVSRRLLLTFTLLFHNCETNLIAVAEKFHHVTGTTVYLCQNVL